MGTITPKDTTMPAKRRRHRAELLTIALLIALGCMVVVSLRVGSASITVSDIFSMILGKAEVPTNVSTIIMQIRLPRILMAVLIGMMLASSGTVVQAVFHNPLADPYIIGISASAVAGAVVAYLFGLPTFFYGVFAFVVSVATTLMIFRLSLRGGQTRITTLLIIGVAVSSFLGAFTSFAMYAIGEDSYRIVVWTMGYLGGASWLKVAILTLPLVVSVAIFYFYRHELDALMTGDEEAHSLGIDVAKLKKRLLLVSCFVVSYSVAFSGMIGFVGLIIPHTMRLLVGYSNTKLLSVTALAGGVFLLIADTLARSVLAPIEVPIGAVTAFLGAPVFIYFAIKGNRGVM